MDVKPNKYLDSYRLVNIRYTDDRDDTNPDDNPSAKKSYKINMYFYDEISSARDWQDKMTKDMAQNYLLTGDVDFTKLPMQEIPVTDVMINRLISQTAAGEENKYTISGLDLEYTDGASYHSLIREVVTEMNNVKFSNIKIRV